MVPLGGGGNRLAGSNRERLTVLSIAFFDGARTGPGTCADWARDNDEDEVEANEAT